MTINPSIAEPGGISVVDAVATESRQTLTPGQLVWRRFRKHRMAMLGGIGVVLLLLFIIIGSIVIPESAANNTDLSARLTGPTATHWFGTDSVGRDVFDRVIYGGQISLFIGVLAVILEVSLGTLIGGIAAYYGGWVDAILMRFTEAMLAIPALFLLIVRAKVLSLKEMDYISASKALGASNQRIFFSHLVPNTLGAIIVAATLGLAGAILTEAYVSFLGLGVQPPTSTWGNMMQQAQSFIIRGAWWMWVFPSLLIVLTILCINLLGDGLRDAFDPRSSRHM